MIDVPARTLLRFVAALTVGVSPALADDLTVVSFGGAYGAAQKKHMIDPFAEATGTNVLFDDYAGGIAEIKAQVETGNVHWDVVDIEVIDLERACSEGLLEVLPHDELPPGSDGVPAQEDFFKEALASECGVGNIVWAVIYAYNTETVIGGTPSTIEDFFDVTTFPGQRALRRRPQVNLEWALIADGVPRDRVYQVLATAAGQARAFAKLDTIKDHVVWYESWSQAPQLLNDGGAVLVQSANGRIYKDIEDYDRPFVIVWDGNVFDLDVWSVVKGTPNRERAFEFVAFATQTTPLAGMQDVAYGPTRRSAAQLVDPKVRDELPTAHIDDGLKVESAFWADFGEGLEEEFSRWLLN
ncbi:MAG: ABC transporter substrate-binding protein [Rhodospirillales bacterium]|nr:ABC transporter substrate-binding protein [Rhodospirillales bacterium]MDE0712912.1 ABC transporter substrate-binding protein [Rhodospirillales bacterium]